MGYVAFSGFVAGLPSALVLVLFKYNIDSFGSFPF